MNEYTPDVVVIGQSLASLIALTKLESEGLDTLLIRNRSEGLLPHWKGAGSIYGPFETIPSQSSESRHGRQSVPKEPQKRLEYLLRQRPNHPYRKLGLETVESLENALQQLPWDELPPFELFSSPRRIVTEDGELIRSDFGLSSMARIDQNSPALILNCTYLEDWKPHRIQELLADSARSRVTEKQLPKQIFGHHGTNPIALAKTLDTDAFIEFLTEIPATEDFERLFVPPVLGATFETFENVASRVKSEFGLEVVEPAIYRRSIHGARMVNWLEKNFDMLEADVSTIETNNKHIERLELNGDVSIQPTSVVLGRGKWINGAFRQNNPFKEKLFDVPLWLDGTLLSEDTWLPSLYGNAPWTSHPINRVGLNVDESLRPLTRHLEPKYTNLYAVGDMIGGTDPIWDGARVGIYFAAAETITLEAIRSA